MENRRYIFFKKLTSVMISFMTIVISFQLIITEVNADQNLSEEDLKKIYDKVMNERSLYKEVV